MTATTPQVTGVMTGGEGGSAIGASSRAPSACLSALRIVGSPITRGDQDAHHPAPLGHPGTTDERLLLTVGEAAGRLGIGRSFMYELIAASQIETIHIGRLCKVPVDALAAFVERQRAQSPGRA